MVLNIFLLVLAQYTKYIKILFHVQFLVLLDALNMHIYQYFLNERRFTYEKDTCICFVFLRDFIIR